MSTLDTNYYKKLRKKYLIFTIFCLIFGIIYEIFSHGVYSNFMIFAFIVPFIMGYLMTYVFTNKNINSINLSIYHLSIITLTTGSIVKGVLDIYGTTNSLIYVYLVVGLILLIISLVLFLKNK